MRLSAAEVGWIADAEFLVIEEAVDFISFCRVSFIEHRAFTLTDINVKFFS